MSPIAVSLKAIGASCMVLAAIAGCLAASGCTSPLALREMSADVALTDIPRELQKVSIPPYRVETPDIPSIESVNNIRPAGDPFHAGDDLGIRVAGTLPPSTPRLTRFKTTSSKSAASTASRLTERSIWVPNMDQSSSKD